jgi:prepilin-type N-terminal cleavage/methylation domain-containing protein
MINKTNNLLVNKREDKIMNKKKKKGFTLIELIVVIAILGVLAAVAIPRFSGFTDKAKLGVDEQYGALVANSALTLIAAGEVSLTNEANNCLVTFDSTNDDGTIDSITNISYTNTAKIADEAALIAAIGKLAAPKAPQYYKTAYTVTFSSTGTKTVGGTK